MWRSEVARYRSATSSSPSRTQCREISWTNGSAAFAAYLNSLADRDIRFGTMIAGNSGRIAGGCGDTINMRFMSIGPGHTTQEENIVSNWVSTMEQLGYTRKQLFSQLLDASRQPRWGLVNPSNAADRTTYQGKDYTIATPSDYFEAWAVQDAVLSGDSEGGGVRRYATDVVFVAGPNVGLRGAPSGSMARTFNSNITTYGEFREAVKQAVRAGLIEMDRIGCRVALVAGVSTGIYAGSYRVRINANFASLVDEILNEESLDGLALVYYITLPSATARDKSCDPPTLERLRADVASLDPP